MKKGAGLRQVIKLNPCRLKFIFLVIVNRFSLLSSFSSSLEELITFIQIMSPSKFFRQSQNIELSPCF
jgi:hypothetical protein